MKHNIYILIILFTLSSCVTEFIPKVNEDKDILVVEGLITDQDLSYTVKLTRSDQLGVSTKTKAVSGGTVTITDDIGNTYLLAEKSSGIYKTDSLKFQGSVGRTYTLHIKLNDENGSTYESAPCKMTPVPKIDSMYYEKTVISEINGISNTEGCNIYLDTHDATNQCKYFRWEYVGTWEIHIPYSVTNKVCYVTDNSNEINIKSTSSLSDVSINKFKIEYISNESDRLSNKYSILVNQYSLSESEYEYWDKLKNFSEQVGGLYDLIPSSVPSNIYNVKNVEEKVLGYFSVSAATSKRLSVKEYFKGLYNPYAANICVDDTVFNGSAADLPNLNTSVWILATHSMPPPSYLLITYSRGCADCTVRGTLKKPDYWDETK